MSRQLRNTCTWVLLYTLLFTGCHPTQPFYLGEDGDLSHYVDVATQMEEPDLQEPVLDEAAQTMRPRTILNADFENVWDLTLEEAIQIAMHNSKVIRSLRGLDPTPGTYQGSLSGRVNQLSVADRSLNDPFFAPTVYDPAITETDPDFGVEGALSVFDAQFSTSMFWEKVDRPNNVDPGGPVVAFTPSVRHQDTGVFTAQVAKQTASGTQFFFRNNTIYDQNNGGGRALPSDYETNFELEARHPILRGGGTQVNRIPVVIARIQTDIELTDFEGEVRNFLSDTERAYWELHMAYRKLDADRAGRDSALVTWRKVHALYIASAQGGEAEKEAQARQQYYEFRARVEAALADLFVADNRLRFQMGLTATDNRLIRPADSPTFAKMSFDWSEIRSEALVRSADIRGHKWRIKQREMELIAARNDLLPQLDAVGLYRFLGLGDDLIDVPRNGANYPAAGSLAFDELTEGRYQEWRVGFELTSPFGFRRELAGVRNAQLKLARDKAVLEAMELEIMHQLTDSIQDLENFYVLTETNFNRWVAADKEVDAVQAAYEANTVTLDLVLDAQRRRSDAKISFERSLINYNLAIMRVHFVKGSLPEYNNIHLAEGPWPAKAYYDAHAKARKRDASYYLDYGWTRPKVISQGQYEQFPGGEIQGEGIGVPTPVEPEVGLPSATNTAPLYEGPVLGDAGQSNRLSSVEPAEKAKFDYGQLGLAETQPARATVALATPTPAKVTRVKVRQASLDASLPAPPTEEKSQWRKKR